MAGKGSMLGITGTDRDAHIARLAKRAAKFLPLTGDGVAAPPPRPERQTCKRGHRIDGVKVDRWGNYVQRYCKTCVAAAKSRTARRVADKAAK